MKKVAVIDVQPNLSFDEASLSLIKFKTVQDGNIGLDRLYELINCNLVERVVLGKLKNGNLIDLIVDEEGTFGQWNRGIQVTDSKKNEITIFGNCVFVQSTSDGDWIGWDSDKELSDAINPFVNKMIFFETENTAQ